MSTPEGSPDLDIYGSDGDKIEFAPKPPENIEGSSSVAEPVEKFDFELIDPDDINAPEGGELGALGNERIKDIESGQMEEAAVEKRDPGAIEKSSRSERDWNEEQRQQ